MADSLPSSRNPRTLMLASIVVVVAALYFARDVLVPLALAVMLSFLLAPLVSRLQRLGLGRITSVIIVMVIVGGVLGSLGFVVFGQIRDLAGKLPQYRVNIEEKVTWVKHLTHGGPFDKAIEVIRETTQNATTQP